MCRPRYTCVTVRMYVADHVVLGNVTGYWDMMGQQGRIHEFFEGGSGREFFKEGVRVQVRGNFHILRSKKNLGGLPPPPLDPPLVRARLVQGPWDLHAFCNCNY